MEPKLGEGHRHFRSRMDAMVQNMFEINYSQLIQYEILEKLVTFIPKSLQLCANSCYCEFNLFSN